MQNQLSADWAAVVVAAIIGIFTIISTTVSTHLQLSAARERERLTVIRRAVVPFLSKNHAVDTAYRVGHGLEDDDFARLNAAVISAWCELMTSAPEWLVAAVMLHDNVMNRVVESLQRGRDDKEGWDLMMDAQALVLVCVRVHTRLVSGSPKGVLRAQNELNNRYRALPSESLLPKRANSQSG